MRIIVRTFFIIFFSITIIAPLTTNAQLKLLKTPTETETFANKSGFAVENKDTDLTTIVSTLINTFLGLLGILFLILIIYGGFRWMNAQGAEEDVTKAKNIITQAVIGLVIIMAAYAISSFVIGRIQEKTLKTEKKTAKTTTSRSTHFV